RRLENERRTVAPFRLNDHHPEPIRPELVRERTAGREPAADETAARVLRPLRVDGAAAFAAEVARHARFHLVPADRALHPAVAARRAGAARALFGRLHWDRGATAL